MDEFMGVLESISKIFYPTHTTLPCTPSIMPIQLDELAPSFPLRPRIADAASFSRLRRHCPLGAAAWQIGYGVTVGSMSCCRQIANSSPTACFPACRATLALSLSRTLAASPTSPRPPPPSLPPSLLLPTSPLPLLHSFLPLLPPARPCWPRACLARAKATRSAADSARRGRPVHAGVAACRAGGP
jgi:hypothetical protein